MQMVTLGTLTVTGAAGVIGMRRKLLGVAQRLGMTTIRITRLAAAASYHAKAAIKHGAHELRARTVIANLLSNMDMVADEAASGEEGIEMVRQVPKPASHTKLPSWIVRCPRLTA